MELSNPELKKLLYFFQKNLLILWGREVSILKSKKPKKFLNFSSQKFFPHFGMTVDETGKYKKIPQTSGCLLIKCNIKTFLILREDC